jgi:two-component system sensor histidine kinase DegS
VENIGKKQMSITRLNEILENTINSIKSSKDEIVGIVDHTRSEYKRLEEELKLIQVRVSEVITQVEKLEILDRKGRMNLSNKNKHFKVFDEQSMKEAYDMANGNRVNLLIKMEEEKNLREKRKETEIRLKRAYEIFKKAEDLNKQISVATEYLMGNADDIAETMDELTKKHYLNIRIIEVQEEERHRVARDIHDGPAQSMANVIVKAELCERLLEVDKDRAKLELNNLKSVTRSSLKDVRKIIYDLRPMSLDDLGLIPTLERYISIFKEDVGISIVLKNYGSFNNIEQAIQITVFRIIQESLSNIRKHSKASSATIVIERSLNKLNLSITDDGIGFDLEKHIIRDNPMEGGFGLVNIKERVELLNGKFQINSSVNMGTKITLLIPLNEEE